MSFRTSCWPAHNRYVDNENHQISMNKIFPTTVRMLLIAMGLVCVLVACGTSPAPVSSRPTPASERINHHIVSKGESLYVIAWRYELAADQLAAANGITAPYTLYAGQRLTLDVSQRRQSSASQASTSQASASKTSTPKSSPSRDKASRKTHTVARGETLYGIARRHQLPLDRLAAANRLTAPYALRIGQRLTLDLSRRSGAKASATAAKATSSTAAKLPKAGWKWGWPVKGKVSRFYDSNRVFKGINIQSRTGHAVTAAAPGVVVYAGDGLRGYGRLVIIKHSETYLSAYAHNRKILVTEGVSVKASSKIAEVGGNSANPGRLYFEIRKNGKPVDPLRLLPTQ